MRFALILMIGIMFPGIAFSQHKASVVVLPFTGSSLSKTELSNLTLLFEASLLRVDSLQVIDQSRREKVLAYLDPALLACEDLTCAIKIGEALSATTVVTGAVIPESGKLTISFRVITIATRRSFKTDSEGVTSVAELPQAVRTMASALFGAPLSNFEGEGSLAAAQEKQQRLTALEALRADLNETIAERDQKRAKARTWGWVSFGVGAASAALMGVSWYLSDVAYQEYLATSDTETAAYYRRKVVLWDSVMIASAGTGVLSVGISIPLFVLSPDSRAEKEELKRVESDIATLKTAAGIKP